MTTPPPAGPFNPSPLPPSPAVVPPPVQRPPSGNSLLGCAFALSVLLNLGAVVVLVLACLGLFFSSSMTGEGGGSAVGGLIEKYHSGSTSGSDKVAIVSLDGIILEGSLGYVHKQIEQAAKDKNIKAVVLRINSPGGSITASDELHQRLTELRDGDKTKKYASKPLVASMASLAASGGYYVAMPAQKIFAERTTMTGSIGVYAALPNVAKLGKDYGFGLNVIKAGEIKDSGSPFKEMTPKEHRVWQDMINTAYLEFLDVVVKGRPKLSIAKLQERFEVKPVLVGPDAAEEKVEPYQRYRADGGIYTAELALKLDLIDAIGTEEIAIAEARKLANLDEGCKVIQYERQKTLTDLLLGVHSTAPGVRTDLSRLKNALSPRLWYLAPGYDLAGLLAAAETP
jgi:protease IV